MKEGQRTFAPDILNHGQSFRNVLKGTSRRQRGTKEKHLSVISDPNMINDTKFNLSRFIPSSSRAGNDEDKGIPEFAFKPPSIHYQKSVVDELDAEHESAREKHSFAFVWFKIKDKEARRNDTVDLNECKVTFNRRTFGWLRQSCWEQCICT